VWPDIVTREGLNALFGGYSAPPRIRNLCAIHGEKVQSTPITGCVFAQKQLNRVHWLREHPLEAVNLMTNPMQDLRRHLLGQPARQTPPRVTDHAATEITRTDQLEYLADLMLELKEIADNLGCATLAGLLVVGHREAMIQAHDR
jgi:hypothetical protein